MLSPKDVHKTLKKHQLVDGFEVVFDMDKSRGIWLYDSVTQEQYLDCFTCFASWPVGYNHSMMTESEFFDKISQVSINNPANSDLYTREMAEFVDMFANHATPDGFDNHFWVAGGALAIENALKTAFDWKARKLSREIGHPCEDLVIVHLREAFHGRSGYTMSLTNTDPVKTGLFPKFNWPRINNPSIEYDLDGNVCNDITASELKSRNELDAAFSKHGNKIAGIIIEPMQGEGGDNHFRSEFLQMLRDYSDEYECLLIYDEIQTGFWGSGKPWMWQHHGVAPDIVSFGKKTQVCGIYANNRVKEVDDNVFSMSSRINSTWGGNLVDMVRSKRFIEIILKENLGDNILKRGTEFVSGLRLIAKEKGTISNVRGVGSLSAFTLETQEARDAMIGRLMNNKLLALKSGSRSIRFRMPLIISQEEVSEVLSRVASSI